MNSIKFKTRWDLIPPEQENNIRLALGDITRNYERWANPEYFRKTMADYLAKGFSNP